MCARVFKCTFSWVCDSFFFIYSSLTRISCQFCYSFCYKINLQFLFVVFSFCFLTFFTFSYVFLIISVDHVTYGQQHVVDDNYYCVATYCHCASVVIVVVVVIVFVVIIAFQTPCETHQTIAGRSVWLTVCWLANTFIIANEHTYTHIYINLCVNMSDGRLLPVITCCVCRKLPFVALKYFHIFITFCCLFYLLTSYCCCFSLLHFASSPYSPWL